MSEYRSALVYVCDEFAGILRECEEGYEFKYASNYLIQEKASPVSLTLPLREEAYLSKTLFPFFDGLIPEGWLYDVVVKNWKINSKDRFGVLLVACKDPIGSVSIAEGKV